MATQQTTASVTDINKIAGLQSSASEIDNSIKSVVNVKDFSTVRDAILYGMAHSQPVYFPPGTHSVVGFTSLVQTTEIVTLIGDDAKTTIIEGSGTEALFSGITTNFKATGLHFKNIDSVIVQDANTDVMNVNDFVFSNNKVTNCSRPIAIDPYNGAQDTQLGANWEVCNNSISDCGDGFRLNICITGYNISGNSFSNIGSNSGYKTRLGVCCIDIGKGTLKTSSVTELQGSGSVSGNSFVNVTNDDSAASGGSTNFIIAEGRNISITGNTGNTLFNTNADAVDQEGIYCKGTRLIISNNTITDAGYFEASIKIKGEQGSTLQSNNIISNNNISWTDLTRTPRVGIAATNAQCSIVSNRIENCSKSAIQIAEDITATQPSIIANNVIVTAYGIDGVGGQIISCKNIVNLIVDSNFIEMDSSYSGNIYHIQAEYSTKAAKNVKITNNVMTIVNEPTAPTGSIRAVRLVDSASAGIHSADISNNTFSIVGANRTVMLISTSIVSNMNIFCCRGNINNSTTSATLYDIIFNPSGIVNLVGWGENTGFTTAVAGSVALIDANKSTGLAGQVQTAQGDGTWLWV